MIDPEIVKQMFKTAQEHTQDPFVNPITPMECLTVTSAYGEDLELVLSYITAKGAKSNVYQLSVSNKTRTAIAADVVESIVKQFIPHGPVIEITKSVMEMMPPEEQYKYVHQRQFVWYDVPPETWDEPAQPAWEQN